MKKQRIDQLLFDMGLAPSRERARASIMAGAVFVDDQRVLKPGTAVSAESKIEVRGETLPYVSRGGLKLFKALKEFDLDVSGLVCLDCGASTGGFTDVLLQNGASKVYAVDVGYGQLAWKLRTDGRVVNLERTNIRYLTREQVPETVDLAVMDLSFISLRLVLPVVMGFLKDSGEIVCLIKPQFEAGREKVGKKGVVRDAGTHREVLKGFLEFVSGSGLSLKALTWSPVRGPEGNIEYLCRLGREGDGIEPHINEIVEKSHAELERKE